jgi:hypothetical protein
LWKKLLECLQSQKVKEEIIRLLSQQAIANLIVKGEIERFKKLD